MNMRLHRLFLGGTIRFTCPYVHSDDANGDKTLGWTTSRAEPDSKESKSKKERAERVLVTSSDEVELESFDNVGVRNDGLAGTGGAVLRTLAGPA